MSLLETRKYKPVLWLSIFEAGLTGLRAALRTWIKSDGARGIDPTCISSIRNVAIWVLGLPRPEARIWGISRG